MKMLGFAQIVVQSIMSMLFSNIDMALQFPDNTDQSKSYLCCSK